MKWYTTRCHGAHNCQNNERCLTHDLWSDLSSQIYTYLNNISLQDLMDRKAVREVADRQENGNESADPGLMERLGSGFSA